MSTVLPLVEAAEDQRLLCQWLETETDYEVVDPEESSLLDVSFDLCIADAPSLERHHSSLEVQKEQEDPVFLPILVVGCRQSIQQLTIDVWEFADSVVYHAIDKIVASESFAGFELEGRLRSLVRRRESALNLTESREQYRLPAEEGAKNSDVEVIVVGPDSTVVWSNQRLTDYFDCSHKPSPGDSYEELVTGCIEPAVTTPEDFAERILPAPSGEGDASFDFEVAGPGNSRDRWIQWRSYPIETGLYEGGRVDYYVDITAKKEHEQVLRNLHQASRDLMQAKTKPEIYDTVVAAADDILGLSASGVYAWDDTTGALQPKAYTAEISELYDEVPAFEAGDSLAWDVFIDGETTVFEDVRTQENVYNPETTTCSELIVPIGEHGVLLSGTETPDEFSESDVRNTEALAANTAAALDRVERAEELAENKDVLQEQNESLTRLNRVNTTIRNIQRGVVEASTRDAVEAVMCDNLVQTDPYQFVWIGTPGQTESVTPRTWAGDENGYLDERLATDHRSDDADQSPARRAWDTREPVVIPSLRSELDTYPWARAALERGYQSAIALPLLFRGTIYGVVEIYADRPAAFSGDEREMLQELCNFVANALSAIGRKQALITESDVELEFQVGELDDVLFRLAQQTGCTFDLTSVFPQPSGTWLLYLTVTDGDPAAIETVSEQLVSVERVTTVEGGDSTFELEISDFRVGGTLAEQGATLHSLTVRPGSGRVVVHLPQTTDIRSFAETCTEMFPDTELVRQNHITSEIMAEETSHLAVDRLTDRQREVLEIAFRSGFFAWPRESTGEEIADQLDVSPPTFHRHVRRGTDILLDSIFD